MLMPSLAVFCSLCLFCGCMFRLAFCVERYVDTLIYGLKSNRNKSEQREFYRRSAEEDVDASMLRLFECFMEATPQLILQICILARDFPHQEEDFWTGE